ncbi:phosphatidylserine decarboxylase-domain-containing protein [Daldinia loculata]|nr:phosphatidylserine decarboxylase-domain-containing protein [Daldinia loculata]
MALNRQAHARATAPNQEDQTATTLQPTYRIDRHDASNAALDPQHHVRLRARRHRVIPDFRGLLRARAPPGVTTHRYPDYPAGAVVVADSRVVAYDSVAETKKLWIKGTDFTITNLVMDAFRGIPRDYYQVDPIALQSGVNILTSNARSYLVIETEQFGDVLFVAIGATDVGTRRDANIPANIHEKFHKPGAKIKKGDEIGYFQFGGSSIIVAFQKGAIRL